MNTALPNSQESNSPGEAIADLIDDMRKLTSTLDSFALFTVAWRQHLDHQRQHSLTARSTQAERTTP
jgi:hypothetical protein